MRKNILIVSDRSNYFGFVGAYLENEFKVSYIAVTKRDKKILKNKGRFSLTIGELVNSFAVRSEGEVLNQDELRHCLHCDIEKDRVLGKIPRIDLLMQWARNYSRAINAYLENKKIDLVIAQNDLWSYASIPALVAKKKGIKTLYFEDGLFRPNTVTLDEKGVNYNNSVPRNRKFYENIEVNPKRLYSFYSERMTASSQEISFPFSVKQILSSLVNPRKILYLLTNPKRLTFLFEKIHDYLVDKKRKRIGLPNDYIFLPLQVQMDSQIFHHSPIKSIEKLINVCYEALDKFNRKKKRSLYLVIKKHPAETVKSYRKIKRKYKNKKVVFLRQFDLNRIIENCKAVITINSTVGIESLLFHKPVITLGNAFYNIDGIVEHCDDPQDLEECLEKVLSKQMERELIDKFLYFLRFRYQLEGNLDHPTRKNIKPAVNRIEYILSENK